MNLEVNGKAVAVDSPADEMLLWVLRDELGLTGTKFGCGAGICGSCTVHIDGVAVRSCVTPVSAAVGKKVTTIEGLARGDKLHPVQQAFIEGQVPQCAWCMSGQVMTAAAFIARSPNPSEADVEAALSANYCRCGCYTRIRTAVVRAAEIAALTPQPLLSEAREGELLSNLSTLTSEGGARGGSQGSRGGRP